MSAPAPGCGGAVVFSLGDPRFPRLNSAWELAGCTARGNLPPLTAVRWGAEMGDGLVNSAVPNSK